MYTLIRHLNARDTLWTEVPALALALVLAEAFFRFHSFTLECLAFLATWLVFSTLAARARGCTAADNPQRG
jgi:hypothetical protein